MIDSDIIEILRRKFTRLEAELNEGGRRHWAARDVATGGPAKQSNWGTAGSRWWPKPQAWGSGRFAVGVKNCVTSRCWRVLPVSGFGAREAGANPSRPMILPWSPRWKR